MPRTLLKGIATLALAMTGCFIVFARKRSDEANSREGGGLRSICRELFRWDISLALNMTYFFYLSLRGSEATKQTPGRVEVRSIYSEKRRGKA